MDPIGWWEKIPLEPRLVGPDQLRSPFGLDKGHPHLFFLGYVCHFIFCSMSMMSNC